MMIRGSTSSSAQPCCSMRSAAARTSPDADAHSAAARFFVCGATLDKASEHAAVGNVTESGGGDAPYVENGAAGLIEYFASPIRQAAARANCPAHLHHP